MEYEKLAPAPPAPYGQLYTMSPTLHDFRCSPSVNPASIYPSKHEPTDRPAFPVIHRHSFVIFYARALFQSPQKFSQWYTKGVTPEALVPIDAPTQPRKYITPSMTSRKEVPSVLPAAGANAGVGDDEDELLEELRPEWTSLSNRVQEAGKNTWLTQEQEAQVEFQQKLIANVEHLSRERDVWRERARMLQGMMEARGLQCPVFL